MSSLRNAVHRRNHKERAQPLARQKYGLLEKKKDYVARARDYHSKQDRLKAMREKAAFRNPDEFYFKMINTRTKEGVHITERNQKFSHDFLKLLSTQDLNYVTQQRDIGRKRIERMQQSMVLLDDVGDAPGEFGDDDEEPSGSLNSGSSSIQKPKNHIVFVDNEDEVKSFDPAKHFDTAPELVHRKFNRPRTEQLKKQLIAPHVNKAEVKATAKERQQAMKELISRMEREETMSKLEQEMTLRKNLMLKGRRQKIGVDKDGLAKYKWKADRKK
ncbi:UTP11-like, U3 small nucleolar ribonucleoprotein [Lobosporangium transversale]|uniref:U3 small nucleolar RNA-associated protein 11 n=1 Tax=Lobosporangium transversale TaxID=64571 RepID=A0A1Y2GVH6_9FUNG|nr:small-subunit processome [Lobosporangium transversale]KAF9897764.1 UTP11-like, U3 small nucleolar ribonucleoprotein [Lobosporangium transversale]ORZ26279.1 small-subunit processome [Lobosporangium transversale]|eukprot:XP_021884044.1 small-subunit processome [Lobosporangium transversale]